MKSLIFAATVLVLTVACDSGPAGESTRERPQSIALTGSEQDAAASPPVANQAAAGIGRIADMSAQRVSSPARDRFESKTAGTATSSSSAIGGAEQVAPSRLRRAC